MRGHTKAPSERVCRDSFLNYPGKIPEGPFDSRLLLVVASVLGGTADICPEHFPEPFGSHQTSCFPLELSHREPPGCHQGGSSHAWISEPGARMGLCLQACKLSQVSSSVETLHSALPALLAHSRSPGLCVPTCKEDTQPRDRGEKL